MKAGFIPGAIVRAKMENVGVVPEVAEIVRYDGECFYIVTTTRSPAWVVHEDDVELVMHADCDNRGGACPACRAIGTLRKEAP